MQPERTPQPNLQEQRRYAGDAQDLRERFQSGLLSELRPYPQFVVWKYTVEDGKLKKRPFNPKTFFPARTCVPYVNCCTPMQTLCKRVERFLPESFVFVAVPGVPAHNNLAERSVRPLVVARKISGGTRSPQGSATRMGLASLFGTWMAQGLNPFHQCLATLAMQSSLGQV